jgi:rhamnose transport system permease protein
LLITTIGSALPSLGVSSVWQNAIVGFLLLAAIAIDRVVAMRVARVLERRRARHG